MDHQFYLADSQAVEDAAALVAEHGTKAEQEAYSRASRSRNLGNVIHYCRWRQIERLVAMMSKDEAQGTVH